MFSNRVKKINSSGIRKVFHLAEQLKDPINLSIGQPDFAAEAALIESAALSMERGTNSYTATQGIEPLRELVKADYEFTENDSRDVIITSGVCGGLALSYSILLDVADEVLIPEPFFCLYRDLAYLFDASPVYYNTYPDFSLKEEELERAYSKRTKALVLNSPANPTGYCLSEEELKIAVDFCKLHDIWLIYDEIYRDFCYDSKHVSPGTSYEKTIILNGFSKSHSVTGWRVGYAIAPKEAVSQMAKVQQYTFVCAPAPFQKALSELKNTINVFAKDLYRKKRDFICCSLSESLEFVEPGGAFYLFAQAPSGLSAEEFCVRAAEKNLLLVPGGDVFSARDSHFRLSFAATEDVLERGAVVINQLCKL